MASIDLDNIIHYYPPPIPKPPSKPPYLATLSPHSSCHPLSQPTLIHPLPPRPSCLSYEPSPTCHPHRQSPFPAVSSLPCDRDACPNEFDRELANLKMVKSGSQETPESCLGGSTENQAENMNDMQSKEMHNLPGMTAPNNDRSRDSVRLLSEDLGIPQDNAKSSNTVEKGLASAGPPTSPVGALDSVSPNELSSIRDHSSTKHRETQLPISGFERNISYVTAGESRHGTASQQECNVSRDQPLSPTPSTPVLAEDEPKSANQRLFRRGSETYAATRKSSLLPSVEANFIQMDARDLSAPQGNFPSDQCDSNRPHSADHSFGGEGSSTPTLPVLQRKKQPASRPEGQDPRRDLSRSSSVSVVVPVKRLHGLPVTRSTRAAHTHSTAKRKSRSSRSVDSDNPDDNNYADGDGSSVGIATLPRLTKRPRRTAATKALSAQARRESPDRVLLSPRPEEKIGESRPSTSLPDIETIPIRGFLTRETFLSKVIYSCTFEEDRQSSCSHGSSKGLSYEESSDKIGHTTQPKKKKPSKRAPRFLPDEDKLLIELKEKQSLPWNRIVKHFPGRAKGALQVRYSTKLKDRGTGS